jgi:hypothetical protein
MSSEFREVAVSAISERSGRRPAPLEGSGAIPDLAWGRQTSVRSPRAASGREDQRPVMFGQDFLLFSGRGCLLKLRRHTLVRPARRTPPAAGPRDGAPNRRAKARVLSNSSDRHNLPLRSVTIVAIVELRWLSRSAHIRSCARSGALNDGQEKDAAASTRHSR